MPDDVNIRPAERADHEAIWQIFHAVISRGDSYVFDPKTPRAEALAYWFAPGTHTFIASTAGKIVGTYILRPNQPGAGDHVANAGFMVEPATQACSVGRAMAEHCLQEAAQLGFRAMQFNFVISTNAPALALWKSLGFGIVGTLPGAFRHPVHGFVDVHIMFRSLAA